MFKRVSVSSFDALPSVSEVPGFQSLVVRMQSCLTAHEQSFTLPDVGAFFNRPFAVTGIGSSEAHGKYLVSLWNQWVAPQATFIPLTQIHQASSRLTLPPLLLISQGLSSNTFGVLDRLDHENVAVMTAISPETDHSEKSRHMARLKAKSAPIIPFFPDDEYQTLIRIAGPYVGYLACLNVVDQLSPSFKLNLQRDLQVVSSLDAYAPPDALVDVLLKHKSLCLVGSYPLLDYSQNLVYKVIEGLFFRPPYVQDVLQMAHGPFQNLAYQREKEGVVTGVIAFVSDSEHMPYYQALQNMLGDDYPLWLIPLQSRPECQILEAELYMNGLLKALIPKLGIDQVSWPGKDRQHMVYSL